MKKGWDMNNKKSLSKIGLWLYNREAKRTGNTHDEYIDLVNEMMDYVKRLENLERFSGESILDFVEAGLEIYDHDCEYVNVIYQEAISIRNHYVKNVTTWVQRKRRDVFLALIQDVPNPHIANKRYHEIERQLLILKEKEMEKV